MGRKQKFTREEVLKRALAVFWEKGYRETSLTDLTTATGLHKGSLYRSFESKENLFLLALKHYAQQARANFIHSEAPLDYLKRLFVGMIKECQHHKQGCFIMNSCVELGSSTALTACASRQIFDEVKANFGAVLQKLSQEKDFSEHKLDMTALQARLVGAAFSIRELSRFETDETVLLAIANGPLQELGVKLSKQDLQGSAPPVQIKS